MVTDLFQKPGGNAHSPSTCPVGHSGLKQMELGTSDWCLPPKEVKQRHAAVKILDYWRSEEEAAGDDPGGPTLG